MKIRQIEPSVIEATELPRIISLKENLVGAPFFLMKLLPAHFILNRARAEGELTSGSVVIETSSGTFGLALAILCNQYGYRLILVSDPAIEPPLRRRMEDLGAQVEIVTEPSPVGGFQMARLNRLAELQAAYPGSFCPSQYDNPHNPGAYAPVAELLAETIGRIDCLVGTVGSGGSMCGTSRFLRLLFPNLQTVGVDTHGSVLFGQPDQKTRLLRGLGNSLMPGNLDHTLFDEVHWVSAAEAFIATRTLHREHALFMGPTSGAAFLVAHWWARENPRAKVVCLLPDEGYRYQDTVYNEEWLAAHKVWLPSMPDAPLRVNHPHQAGTAWSWMPWSGATYEEILQAPFSAR